MEGVGLAVRADDHARLLQHDCAVRRYAFGHHAVRADADIVAHGDAADDFCAGADVDVVADPRRAVGLGALNGVGADRHLLENGAVPADDGDLGDENPAQTVRQGQAPVNLCGVRDGRTVCIADFCAAVPVERAEQRGFCGFGLFAVAPERLRSCAVEDAAHKRPKELFHRFG